MIMKTKVVKKIEENGIVAVISERTMSNSVVDYQIVGTREHVKQYGYADTLETAEDKAMSIIDALAKDAKGTGMIWDEKAQKAVPA